jgi:hypothetical protein
MRRLIAAFVTLALVFAGLATYDVVTSRQNPSPSGGGSITITSTFTTYLQSNSNGSARPFVFAQWNQSTPNTFSIAEVKFALWTNTTVTYTGGTCYGPSNGYAGYKIIFPDESSESITTCTLGQSPSLNLRLTQHQNPQAGILIVPSTGQVYFVVSKG